MKNFRIINGNSLEELKKFPDNYFDSVVTDPPYGLGKEPNANEMLKAWIEIGFLEVKGSGFMGKEWDAFVPQPLFWKEVFRVLKHGGHVAAFFGTRTYDWGVMAIRLAGFEIRDSIQFAFDDSKYRDEFFNSLTSEQKVMLGQILKNGENIALWSYGSGFPKSHNIGKAIEGTLTVGSANTIHFKNLDGEKSVVKNGYTKMQFENGIRPANYNDGNGGNYVTNVNYTTKEAKQWDGWGSALKPAVEPIVLARKPLEKGLSIAQNVLKWGTGAINIDGCRIGDEVRTMPIFSNDKKEDSTSFNLNANIQHHREETNEGRFPANLLMSHHTDCCFNGMKKLTNSEQMEEDWTCVDGCPIKTLDSQSGILKSGKMTPEHTRTTNGSPNGIYGKFDVNHPLAETYGDSGGASRFFYCAKASKSERNFGLDNFEDKFYAAGNQAQAELKRGNIEYNANSGKDRDERNNYNQVGVNKNIHPTVKPIKLMQYVSRLITPPNGKVLDPFNGSGTTGVACVLENFDYTGIEIDAEYCKISEARINAWDEVEEYEDYKKIIENQEEEKEMKKLGVRQTNLFED